MPSQKTKSTPSVLRTSPPKSKERILGEKKHNTKASLSSLIKSSRDIMRKDAGLNGDLDRLPQLSWILFLKCYDDLEIRREEDAKATRQKYKPIIPPPYRWRDWASNENEGATGEDLIKFVNDGLLPALRGLSGSDERLKVAEVFKETYSRMLSGYLLRDVVNLVVPVTMLLWLEDEEFPPRVDLFFDSTCEFQLALSDVIWAVAMMTCVILLDADGP